MLTIDNLKIIKSSILKATLSMLRTNPGDISYICTYALVFRVYELWIESQEIYSTFFIYCNQGFFRDGLYKRVLECVILLACLYDVWSLIYQNGGIEFELPLKFSGPHNIKLISLPIVLDLRNLIQRPRVLVARPTAEIFLFAESYLLLDESLVN